MFTIEQKQKARGSLPQESSNSRVPLLKVKDTTRTERNDRAFLAGVAAGLRRSEINKDAVVSAQLERIRVLKELNFSYQAEAAVANRTAGSLEVQLQRQTELAADLQRQLDTANTELLKRIRLLDELNTAYQAKAAVANRTIRAKLAANLQCQLDSA